MYRFFFRLFPAAALVCFLGGCGETEPELIDGKNAAGQPVVYASIAPLAGLIERIGGDRIEVRTLIGREQDPHDFSPTPKQLVGLGRSTAFFLAGMPFERLMIEKITSKVQFVNAAKGLKTLKLDDDHHHGSGDAHEHHGEDLSDPHVWLSPPLLLRQVQQIAEALRQIDPENGAAYQESADQLKAEIENLHQRLTEKLAPFRGQSFYVYHGAFAYFAEAYGLKQEAIQIRGRSPEPKHLYELIDAAKADGVRLILVQPQFDQSSAETIAEAIGGAVLAIDPLDRDVFTTLEKIAEAISSGRDSR